MNQVSKRCLSVFFIMALLVTVVSCAGRKPIDKAIVSADVAYKNLLMTRSMIMEMKTSPDPILQGAYGDAAKLWNDARAATLLYAHVLQVWEAAGSKPTNYDEVVEKMSKLMGDVMKFLIEMGVLK